MSMRTQLQRMILPVLPLILWAVIPVCAADLSPVAPAALTSTAITPGLTAAQIVERLDAHNEQRAEALRGYDGMRSYTLSYRGFFMRKKAAMEVISHYRAPASKRFDIVSDSGSKMLQSHVLKKLLESEEEAMSPENRRETALTPENYSFQLVGTRPSPYGGCYRLKVTPRRENKFLYRGEICVNAADFAVEAIDAQPAKNPSFWISKTRIHHRYKKVGKFWLPASDTSVTKVRLGGKATLKIDYSEYELR
jgi:hypothetical protein